MPDRIRVIYPNEAIFISPWPGTGYCFKDNNGNFNNNYSSGLNNNNLIKHVKGVTSFNYEQPVNREDIKQISLRSLVARPIINWPEIPINISYTFNSLFNEYNFGINLNSGEHICPISGFTSRDYNTYRDKKNLFLAICNEGQEVLYSTLPNNIFADNKELKVVGFGNCFVTSYQTTAAVGQIPSASITLLAENITYDISGSGISIPAIDTKSGTRYSGIYCNIPPASFETEILLPQNIDISFTSGANIVDLGINLSRCFIQGYNINFNIPREVLGTLGYRLPVDRRVIYPALATINFTAIINDFQSGSFEDLIKKDINYNFVIKLQSGCYTNKTDIIRYDILNAKFNSISYDSSIGANKLATFKFDVEMNPDSKTMGLFISGRV